MKDNDAVETASENIHNIQVEMNEYSIYDYLKKTPSVLVALFSVIIAIVTFFAKLITIIIARKELTFWEFDISYLNFAGESLVFNALISIVITFVVSISVFWFLSTYEAYLPYKKKNLINRYIRIRFKKEIKIIKQKYKNDKIVTKENENIDNLYQQLCNSSKAIRYFSWKLLIINYIPILIALYVGCFVLFIATSSSIHTNIWGVMLVYYIIQTIMLWICARLISAKSINKKNLKKKCLELDYIEEYRKIDCDVDRFPIVKLSSGGLRSVLKNSTIISVVIVLLVNCVLLCLLYSLTAANPTKSSKTFQITSLDERQYVLVYRQNDQYFLEEADIQQIESDSGTKDVLTVYTNKQRIITTDDISFSVFEFDDIEKDHKN